MTVIWEKFRFISSTFIDVIIVVCGVKPCRKLVVIALIVLTRRMGDEDGRNLNIQQKK